MTQLKLLQPLPSCLIIFFPTSQTKICCNQQLLSNNGDAPGGQFGQETWATAWTAAYSLHINQSNTHYTTPDASVVSAAVGRELQHVNISQKTNLQASLLLARSLLLKKKKSLCSSARQSPRFPVKLIRFKLQKSRRSKGKNLNLRDPVLTQQCAATYPAAAPYAAET